MKTKRRYLLALSLASIGAIGAFASVSAASISAGTPNTTRDQVKTAIQQAITVGDYQAYLATTKDYKVGAPVLTETQFNAMVEANKVRSANSTSGVKPVVSANKNKQGVQGLGKVVTTTTQRPIIKQTKTTEIKKKPAVTKKVHVATTTVVVTQ